MKNKVNGKESGLMAFDELHGISIQTLENVYKELDNRESIYSKDLLNDLIAFGTKSNIKNEK